MNKNDLKFDRGDFRLNCRSAAVVINNEHVLLHKLKTDDFWALPGGRVEFFEFSDSTVIRELREELGWECKVIRHLWYVENFFEGYGTKYHELSNYYLVKIISEEKLDCHNEFYDIEGDNRLVFMWFPISELPQMNIKPDFLKNRLSSLPNEVEFIKINEIKN